jgi:hypothetical protein
MALTQGSRLGPYEIIPRSAPAVRARYIVRAIPREREAQTPAALNHPNIEAIYGIEQGAIVRELVVGEGLKGPVPVETGLSSGWGRETTGFRIGEGGQEPCLRRRGRIPMHRSFVPFTI